MLQSAARSSKGTSTWFGLASDPTRFFLSFGRYFEASSSIKRRMELGVCLEISLSQKGQRLPLGRTTWVAGPPKRSAISCASSLEIRSWELLLLRLGGEGPTGEEGISMTKEEDCFSMTKEEDCFFCFEGAFRPLESLAGK